MLYSKEFSFQGSLFLQSALKGPILSVMASDDIDLEFEPLLVYKRSVLGAHPLARVCVL
jgi:hypothetical protein